MHPLEVNRTSSFIYRIKGLEPNRLKINATLSEMARREFCWICDGWREVSFNFPNDNYPMFVHCEFEDYEGFFMNKYNELSRMVPPQTFKYFFTNNCA